MVTYWRCPVDGASGLMRIVLVQLSQESLLSSEKVSLVP